MIPVQRSLRAEEKALLDFLLSADFPGRDEVKEQAEDVKVVGECKCGCGTIDLAVPPGTTAANNAKRIPVEGYGDATDVWLFAENSPSSMLEIVNYADPPPSP